MTTVIAPEVQARIELGIALLRQGGVIAFPTDTVYGLGATIDRPEAITRIYAVKQRPVTMALPLLLADIAQLELVAERVPEAARRLAEEFWPGALTLVLPKSDGVPDTVTAGAGTVAVRVPAHPIPLAIITGCGMPITGTSANLSGYPSPQTADEVQTQLGAKIDLIIDAGRTPGGRESTIIDLTGKVPVVRREGAIPTTRLRLVCPEILTG